MLKYFRSEEDPKARLPKTFIQGFIEVSYPYIFYAVSHLRDAFAN